MEKFKIIILAISISTGVLGSSSADLDLPSTGIQRLPSLSSGYTDRETLSSQDGKQTTLPALWSHDNKVSGNKREIDENTNTSNVNSNLSLKKGHTKPAKSSPKIIRKFNFTITNPSAKIAFGKVAKTSRKKPQDTRYVATILSMETEAYQNRAIVSKDLMDSKWY